MPEFREIQRVIRAGEFQKDSGRDSGSSGLENFRIDPDRIPARYRSGISENVRSDLAAYALTLAKSTDF